MNITTLADELVEYAVTTMPHFGGEQQLRSTYSNKQNKKFRFYSFF